MIIGAGKVKLKKRGGEIWMPELVFYQIKAFNPDVIKVNVISDARMVFNPPSL
ncbi:Uncharacterised protein [uncultured archaeon]|nr:Uncharacterised protein [uncultured archaeon]